MLFEQALALNAIILAGGFSLRMGQDKALIPIAGVPLLLRVCQIAQQCCERVFVVTPWIDRYEPLFQNVKPAIHFIQETPVDPTQPNGSLVGFLQGLEQIQGDWVLLLACDLPNLEVEVLQQWSSQLATMPAEVIACLPRNPQGWWEPLCGFYRTSCRASLQSFVAAGGRSFQDWLAGESVQVLAADPAMLFNCNTPEELQQVTGGESSD